MGKIEGLTRNRIVLKDGRHPLMDKSINVPLQFEIGEHARGINSKEPPATPDGPQALIAESTQRMIAVGRSTAIPRV